MSESTSVDSGTENPIEIEAVVDDVDTLQEAVVKAEELAEADVSDAETGELADLLATLKRLENAAEDARKQAVEPVLDDRVEVGETVSEITRVQSHSKYVPDEEAAIHGLREAGADPQEAMTLNAAKLVDVAEESGLDPDAYVDRSHYSFYRRS